MSWKIITALFIVIFLSTGCSSVKKREGSKIIGSLKSYLSDPKYPDSFWITSTPDAEGMNSSVLEDGVKWIESTNYEVHSFLIVKNSKLILEYYGLNKTWANNKQETPDDLHELHSTTKTFTSVMIGIAIDEKKIGGVHDKVMDYFKNDNIQNKDSNKSKMTIENLLTMQSSLQYTEGSDDHLFTDPENSGIAILSRPMTGSPGTVWNYSTGNSQVLSEIIRKVTGKTPKDFAEEKLFNPMGITNYIWQSDKSGTQYGGMGLSLKPRDMAKFGLLLLKNGIWDNKSLVPANWINEMKKSKTKTPWPTGDYSYHCWIPNLGGFATRGYMGQEIYMFPDKDLIVVFTSAIPYREADITLDKVVSNYVLPAIKK